MLIREGLVMDKSVRLVIEKMKTAKRIKIEFDDLEIMPIYDDKILAHDIAIAFQGYANRHLTHKMDRYAEEDMDSTGRGYSHPVIRRSKGLSERHCKDAW